MRSPTTSSRRSRTLARRDCGHFCPWHSDSGELERTVEIQRREFRQPAAISPVRAPTPIVGVTGTIAGDTALNQTALCERRVAGLHCQFCAAPRAPASDPADDQHGSTSLRLRIRRPQTTSANSASAIKDSAGKDKDKDDDKDKEERQGQGGGRMQVTARGMELPRSNHHYSEISTPDSVPSTPVPTAWARPPTARERLPQTFFSACRYGTVPSFTRICLCGRASA